MMTVAPPLSACLIMIDSSFLRSFSAAFSAFEILLLHLVEGVESISFDKDSNTTVKCSLFDLGGTKFDLFFAKGLSEMGSSFLLKYSSSRNFRWNSCRSASSSFLFCSGVGVNFIPRLSSFFSSHVSSLLDKFMIFGSIIVSLFVPESGSNCWVDIDDAVGQAHGFSKLVGIKNADSFQSVSLFVVASQNDIVLVVFALLRHRLVCF